MKNNRPLGNCKITNFRKRLIFVNHNFSLFVNSNFRKFGLSAIKICMKKPSVKTNFCNFALFTKFTKICRLRKFLVSHILQIFGVVLFSVFSVVIGFTEIKKTPK